jgi:hypothetical protein
MKPNAKPEISKKWWTSEKPADVKGADLEKALANAEKALADADKKKEPAAIDACLTALKDVESAADKTIKKECDKKKHKDVIGVLEKYAALVKSESSRLEDLKKKAAKGAAAAAEANGEEDEEEDEGKSLTSASVWIPKIPPAASCFWRARGSPKSCSRR